MQSENRHNAFTTSLLATGAAVLGLSFYYAKQALSRAREQDASEKRELAARLERIEERLSRPKEPTKEKLPQWAKIMRLELSSEIEELHENVMRYQEDVMTSISDFQVRTERNEKFFQRIESAKIAELVARVQHTEHQTNEVKKELLQKFDVCPDKKPLAEKFDRLKVFVAKTLTELQRGPKRQRRRSKTSETTISKDGDKKLSLYEKRVRLQEERAARSSAESARDGSLSPSGSASPIGSGSSRGGSVSPMEDRSPARSPEPEPLTLTPQ